MFLDIRLAGVKTGIDVLKEVLVEDPLMPIIMMSGYDDKRTMMHCLEIGAVDYFVKGSVNPSAYAYAVHKASVWRKRNAETIAARNMGGELAVEEFRELIGCSPSTTQLKSHLAIVGKTDGPFLVIGETGTGKELAARALWSAMGSENRPFITVNCAEFQTSTIEGELFGYEKGAFTGANAQRVGLFEAAHGGDIFLDEIGELPLEFQAKLLRVIQEKKVRRMGSNHERKFEFRVIAATNRNLRREVQNGRFRSDLFYRLDVHSLFLTPLRERTEDVPQLLKHFYGVENKSNVQVEPSVLNELLRYSWPGNVRQLIGLVKFTSPLLDSVDARLTASEWSTWLTKQDDVSMPTSEGDQQETIRQQLSDGRFEYDRIADASRRSYIEMAMDMAKNSRTEAAKLLGVSRQRLSNWLTEG